MPTTEQLSTPEISSAHIVTHVVDPVKYDACSGTTGAVQNHDEPLTYANNSGATDESLGESEDGIGRTRQSRAVASDFTTIRMPT